MKNDECNIRHRQTPPRKETYIEVKEDVRERCDICVIGSGAAGAILAKKLSDSGRSVIILERGGYLEGEDMNQRDEDMIPSYGKTALPTSPAI